MKALIYVVLAVALTACGPSVPTFDASNDQAMQDSLIAIEANLPEDRQKEFKNAIAGIFILGGLMSMSGEISKEEARAKILAKLDGKTGEEIIALSQEMKAAMKK